MNEKDIDGKRAAIARAAKNIVKETSTEIDEVINPAEDQNIQWRDRFAASLATLFVAGVSYSIVWFALLYVITYVGAGDLIVEALRGWRVVGAFTLATSIAAFIRPYMTTRIFGYLMKPFNNL